MSEQSIGELATSIVSGLGKERQMRDRVFEDGVYTGIDIERYHKDVDLFGGEFSISSSGIRALLDRPLLYWNTSPYNPDRFEPEQKRALDFGRAAHHLLLGEKQFQSEFAILDFKDFRSGDARKARDLAKSEGKTPILAGEVKQIMRMADVLSKSEPIKLGLLNGRIERSIFHQDISRSIPVWLRARPDAIPTTSGDYTDLKTAASVDDESLQKAIFNNGYHIQAGMLRKVVRAVLGDEAFQSFSFVFVEKSEPFDVRVMQLKDTDIDLGEMQVNRGLDVLERCLSTNEWPGYDGFNDAFRCIEMPGWARTRIETDLQYQEAAE